MCGKKKPTDPSDIFAAWQIHYPHVSTALRKKTKKAMDLAFKAISIPKASREMLEIPNREANPAFCLKRLNKPKNQSSEMPVF
jgi:hypothetical protein